MLKLSARVSLKSRLFSDADNDAVLIVDSEGLNSVTLSVFDDAVCSDVALNELSEDSVCTLLGETAVDHCVTRSAVGITGDGNLGVGVLLEVVHHFVHLHDFAGAYLCGIDEEEYVAGEALYLNGGRCGSRSGSGCGCGLNNFLFLHFFYDRSHNGSRSHHNGCSFTDASETELQTCISVEEPVGVATVLGVELIGGDGSETFEVEGNALGKTEVKLHTTAAAVSRSTGCRWVAL